MCFIRGLSGVSNCYTFVVGLHMLYSGVRAGGGGWVGGVAKGTWYFSPGNFWCSTRKREARKKVEMEKKRRKIKKGKVENWKWKEEIYKNKERTFFFFFFFFSCFSLFKMIDICFGYTKIGIFYLEKVFHTYREQNQEKWLCSLWKIVVLCPWCYICIGLFKKVYLLHF